MPPTSAKCLGAWACGSRIVSRHAMTTTTVAQIDPRTFGMLNIDILFLISRRLCARALPADSVARAPRIGARQQRALRKIDNDGLHATRGGGKVGRRRKLVA